MHRRFILLLSAFLPMAGAQAQVFTYSFSGDNIPDDSPLGGVTLTGNVPSDTPAIGAIKVTFALTGVGVNGAFNGDYYAYLLHGSGFAVLLNRTGARTGEPDGYTDNGMNVVFDDANGSAGDIHVYRDVLYGNHDTVIPPPGVLTGIWHTDGREADPGSVVPGSPRTATLDSFRGINPAGSWSLYIEDLSGGGAGKVDHWDIEITAVPEPAEVAFVTALGLGGLVLWRRRRSA